MSPGDWVWVQVGLLSLLGWPGMEFQDHIRVSCRLFAGESKAPPVSVAEIGEDLVYDFGRE
jgi:hypothetical protein